MAQQKIQNSAKQSQMHAISNSNIHRVLRQMGLEHGHQLCRTLQGTIWRAQYTNQPKETVVIKITDQSLHKQSKCVINGTTYDVDENIINEHQILRELTHLPHIPKSIIKFKQFVTSHSMYCLVMQDGGNSLFKFVQNVHHLISQGMVVINEWHRVIHIILRQMVECLHFLHSNNVCHMDISLENFVISEVDVDVSNTQNKCAVPAPVTFVTESIQIKLCDFGLAQRFPDAQCLSSKHCGKRQYQSPEIIIRKEGFSAKKNDIWGSGVCVFMMMVGCPPFQVANQSDPSFVSIMNGHMADIVKFWGKEQYIDSHLMALLN
eukprot:132229_1